MSSELRDKNVSPEKHAARKGCIETLMEQGLSAEEAQARCFRDVRKDWSGGYSEIAKQHALHTREARFQDSVLGRLFSALGGNNR